MMDRMRLTAGMVTVAVLLAASPAWADGARAAPKPGPLKPGRSAGVQIAQQARTGLALISAGAIIAIVLVATTAGGGGSNPQPNAQSVPATTTP